MERERKRPMPGNKKKGKKEMGYLNNKNVYYKTSNDLISPLCICIRASILLETTLEVALSASSSACLLRLLYRIGVRLSRVEKEARWWGGRTG